MACPAVASTAPFFPSGGGCSSSSVSESVDYLNADELPLPLAFVEFLRSQNVDPRVYCAAQNLPRYIRLKPSASRSDVEEELSVPLEDVWWMPGFFKLPAHVPISSTRAYREGKIYGMDVASGAPAVALDIQPGDHVLDICAAPGAKLCMIAELLETGSGGTLTGVDISRPRLAACRTMLQKYQLGNRARLFLADGTMFSIGPLKSKHSSEARAHFTLDGHVSSYLVAKGTLALKEWTPRRTRREKQAEQRAIRRENEAGVKGQTPEIFFYGKDSGVPGSQLPDVLQSEASNSDEEGYDKVLVDAECTHDGSLKHICKFEQWGWDTFEKRFFDPQRISAITDLQLKLLSNGFRLLKCGGTLVYSTCSFTIDQNEGVVNRFLSAHQNVELREIEAAKWWPCRAAGVKHCLRFDPIVSSTNGQFVAKFVKLSVNERFSSV